MAVLSDAETQKKIVKARLRLLWKHPFFGQIALRLRLVNADDWCPTAAVNGREFFYNTAFVSKLSDDETVFLVAHEIYHCIYEHFLRREDRDPEYWNMAGDYVINLHLKQNNIGKFIASGLLDEKYKGMVTEQVYELLKKSGAKKQQTIDVHLDLSGAEGNAEGGGKTDKNGNRISGLSPEERAALADEIKQIILQAAQTVDAGSLPAEIKRVIQSLTQSKMNWREYLRASIESTIKSDFSWMRPNRKGWHMGAVLPGMTPEEQINICIAVDTSGSIGMRMLQDFLGEVQGIMSQYASYRIQIWQFDTRVYGYDEFTNDNGKDIMDYQIKGGGGTNFMVNWDYMLENEIKPDQFVMFTDGEPFGSWGIEDFCDTLFVIHSNPKKLAPFGSTVHYEQ